MHELADLLADYKITGPTSFLGVTRILGRRRLRDFLSDLVAFGSSHGGVIARQPGELRVAPAGGYLGIGTADEVIRQLLLYADHVVFDNQVSRKAATLLGRFDAGDFQSLKQQTVVELHPLLFQFFAIEPAWRRGIVSFGYGSETEHTPKHPLTDHVKSALKPNLKYTPPDGGPPWLQLLVGPRTYLANTSARFMNPVVYPVGPPYSTNTRDLNKLSGAAWNVFGPGDKPRGEGDPEELLSGTHDLTEALDEFVSFEIENVERLTRLCIDHSAQLVTDSPAEWNVLNALAAYDEQAAPIADRDTATFMFQLAQEIPFIATLPLPSLLDLRDELTDEFHRFRGDLFQLTRAHTKGDPQVWRAEAQDLLHQSIEPALATLSQHVRAKAEAHLNTALAALAAVTLTGLIAWVSGSALPLLPAIPFLRFVLESSNRYAESQDDPMFFLLRVRDAGD